MKRVHRRNFNDAGHAHELTFSCYQRLPLLDSDRFRGWLAESINLAKRSLAFHVWAYVFMPEHVHMIVYSPSGEYDISKIRAAIKEPVGRRALNYFRTHDREWLPRLIRRRGNREEYLFWQSGGGYDRNIDSPATLLKAIEYIHLNPVRQGLVDGAMDWPWSSARRFIREGTSAVEMDVIPAAWLDSQ